MVEKGSEDIVYVNFKLRVEGLVRNTNTTNTPFVLSPEMGICLGS